MCASDADRTLTQCAEETPPRSGAGRMKRPAFHGSWASPKENNQVDAAQTTSCLLEIGGDR